MKLTKESNGHYKNILKQPGITKNSKKTGFWVFIPFWNIGLTTQKRPKLTEFDVIPTEKSRIIHF